MMHATGPEMNARAVAAWSAAGLLVVVLTNNPAYRGLVLLAALNFVLAHRRPGTRLRPLLMMLAVATLISVLVSLLLSHTGAHVLLVLPPAIPVFGGPLTIESAMYGAGAGLGIAAGAMVVAPLSLVVESHQLVDALPAPLHRAGTTLAASLNLIPGIGRSVTAVREAQTMRGWRPRGPRSYAEILVPVTLTALENSIQLAEAMEARGYGSGPRTRLAPARLDPVDALTLVVACVAAAAFIAGRASGTVTDWFPYPSPTWPAVDPLMVAACLLLALPALVRRHD
jgi:energy-coupling factor transport system permease protein